MRGDPPLSGRLGLGKLSKARPTTDDIPSIVVSDLFAGGAPRSDSFPVVRRWSNRGIAGEVEMTVVDDTVECTYRSAVGPRSNEQTYRLYVSWTYPHYGGQRPWLHCALPSCQRRSGRLFLDDPYLVCRECAGVQYPSQLRRRPRHVQRVERAKAIRSELGGRPTLADPFPSRPKGMHRKTYERLHNEALQIESAERERIETALQDGSLSFRDLLARLQRDA